MTLVLDEQLLNSIHHPCSARSSAIFLISTSTSGDGVVGDSTGAPSPALRAGGVVGSAAHLTCFFLRARRLSFFFSSILLTVLTGAAVPALR